MPHYKILSLEVGYTETFPADFTFDGYYLGGETMFNPFSMTLLQGEGLNILVDCGIDMDNPKKCEIYASSGSVNGHSPGEILATVGLTTEDIDAVILTHLHWDHASGLACYPKAKFYLQREELDGWTKIAADSAYTAVFCRSFDPGDLEIISELDKQGRLVLLDSETDNLFPGISIRVSRMAHSFAQQMVLIKHDAGTHLIVGDVCNRPENLTGTGDFPFFIPNPKFSVGSALNAIEDYKRIMKWVDGDVNRVVITHDGTRHGRFPEHKTPLGLSFYEICL